LCAASIGLLDGCGNAQVRAQEVLVEGIANLRTACDEVGRDPASIGVRAGLPVALDDDGRVDLGFIEFALTIPLAIACHFLWKNRPLRACGYYVGVTLTAYAPVRFLLDFLRVEPTDIGRIVEADPRYAGLTPAQWMCFVALACGLDFVAKTRSAGYVCTAVLAEGSDEDDDSDEEEGDEPSEAAESKADPAPDARGEATDKKTQETED
jgi:hypothetical protein